MQPEQLWIDQNDQYVDVDKIRKDAEGTTHLGRLSNDHLSGLGLREITIYQMPDDYSEREYYRTGPQMDAPYIIYTRKSDEELCALRGAEIEAAKEAIRKEREVDLNRLMGIAFVADKNGNTALVQECLATRQKLLDITSRPEVLAAQDGACCCAALHAAYAQIAAEGSAALKAEFTAMRFSAG